MVTVARHEALREVNGFRVAVGAHPLEGWPEGKQNDPQDCPVGLALTQDNPQIKEVYVEENTLTLIAAEGCFEAVLQAAGAFSRVAGVQYSKCPILPNKLRLFSKPTITVHLKPASLLAQMIRNVDLGCYPDLIREEEPWDVTATLSMDANKPLQFKPRVLVAIL